MPRIVLQDHPCGGSSGMAKRDNAFLHIMGRIRSVHHQHNVARSRQRLIAFCGVANGVCSLRPSLWYRSRSDGHNTRVSGIMRHCPRAVPLCSLLLSGPRFDFKTDVHEMERSGRNAPPLRSQCRQIEGVPLVEIRPGRSHISPSRPPVRFFPAIERLDSYPE